MRTQRYFTLTKGEKRALDDMDRSKQDLVIELQQLREQNKELKMERDAGWNAFPAPFVIIGVPDGQFIYGNPNVRELFGIDPSDCDLNSYLSQITVMRPDGPFLSPEAIPMGLFFAREKSVLNIEIIMRNARGVKCPVIANSAPILDDHGNMIASIIVFEDVRKYKLAEAGLKKVVMLAEKRSRELKGVIQALPTGLIIFDKQGNVLDVNGYSEDYFKSHRIDREKTLPERVDQTQGYKLNGQRLTVQDTPVYQALTKGETVKDITLMTWNTSGETVYTTWNCAPIKDNKGEVKGAVAIHKDITEEVRLETALRKSRRRALELVDELYRSNENKNAFINMLSHELRNPLASAMMGMEMIEKLHQEGEWNPRIGKIVKRQLMQLAYMVDDLLDVTHITENNLMLKKERVELNGIVQQAIEEYQWQFVYNGVLLNTEFTVPLYLDADPVRLVQAVGNLLHNAIKFTEKDREVHIAVSRHESEKAAVITIRDTGMGMDKEMLSGVFEPFLQADKSMDRRRGGLGLGLSIVKGIVDLHGGDIAVKSDGLGRGTEFTIRLPILPTEEESPQEKEEGPAGSLKILVIDDMPDITEIMTALLMHLGHEVASAADGMEGIEKARTFRPQVLFCDIGLPGMNGYEVAEYFCGDEELKDITMIAFSGYNQPEDHERSKKAGFKAHLAKPVDLDTLEQVLRDCAKNKMFQKK